MTIKNTYCELEELTSSQVSNLKMLIPETEHFDFFACKLVLHVFIFTINLN